MENPLHSDNRDAWLVLLRAPGLGPASIRSALARHGDVRAALAALRRGVHTRELKAETRSWLDAPDAALLAADHDWLAKPDHHLIGWDSEDYPALLREAPGAPAALFVAGDANLLWMPQLAIVGSRNASAAGLATTRLFARALALAGFTITSGLADGIDGAAHAATLESGGHTIAVLGTGPDLVYPRKHRQLAQAIASRGALVSEFPPGTAGKAEHFPRRNRIISGLALGTLVVEASVKSGSLITARYATEQGREVFAIPGSIHNPLARGCHQLIRDGARLTETSDEIIRELAALAAGLGDRLRERLQGSLELDVTPAPEGPAAAEPRDATHQKVLDALGHDAASLDELAERSGLTVSVLSSMLLALELDGEVSASRGTYVRIPRSGAQGGS
ncbi:MAG: DNA-processing protein DprA [Dokdonella sp.]